MSKRSNFERRERDFYPTPEVAVLPLLPHLEYGDSFSEPCAGDGALVKHLEKHGISCYSACDIEPKVPNEIHQLDSLSEDYYDFARGADYIITNPPWDRKILHPMIDHFRKLSPTWLLFDADWMHTKQSAPYMPYCHKIVSVGRVKWFPKSNMTGKDNCAWYLFGRNKPANGTAFYGREDENPA